jgi:hypothetical protein
MLQGIAMQSVYLEDGSAIQSVNGEGDLDLQNGAKDADVSTMSVRSDVEQGP